MLEGMGRGSSGQVSWHAEEVGPGRGKKPKNAVSVQGVSLDEPWRLLHGRVRASPDVLTSWLLSSCRAGISRRACSSCSVLSAPSAEKAQHHAHCEGEMLERVPSVITEHTWKGAEHQ